MKTISIRSRETYQDLENAVKCTLVTFSRLVLPPSQALLSLLVSYWAVGPANLDAEDPQLFNSLSKNNKYWKPTL